MSTQPTHSPMCRGLARVLALFGAVTVAWPARAEFAFRHHYVDRNLPGGSYGQTSLVDVDRDGDLDFITGGRDADRHVFWFEYRAPDQWARHVLGKNHPSDVGGAAFDVDGPVASSRTSTSTVGRTW